MFRGFRSDGGISQLRFKKCNNTPKLHEHVGMLGYLGIQADGVWGVKNPTE